MNYPRAAAVLGFLVLTAWMVVALPMLALGDSSPEAAASVFRIEGFPLSIASGLLTAGGLLGLVRPHHPPSRTPLNRKLAILWSALSTALGMAVGYALLQTQ